MPKPAPYVLIMHWFFIPCPRPTACKITAFSETPPQNPVNSFFFPVVPVIRITLEEIVVQQVSHLEQQVGITSLSKVYNGECPRRIRRTMGVVAALRRHALRHCERSEAIQAIGCFLDCFVPRNDTKRRKTCIRQASHDSHSSA